MLKSGWCNPIAQDELTRMDSFTVEEEEFEVVSNFCYLGDMLDAEGSVTSAVTVQPGSAVAGRSSGN